jgi:hypothetical protein
MPETLSRHFGHLFVRDPLVILQEYLHPHEKTYSYHFEVSLIDFLFAVIICINFRI